MTPRLLARSLLIACTLAGALFARTPAAVAVYDDSLIPNFDSVPETFVPGGDYTFTLSFTNYGLTDAVDLPFNLTSFSTPGSIVNAAWHFDTTGSTGSCAPASGTCDLTGVAMCTIFSCTVAAGDPVPPGQVVILQVTLTTSPTATDLGLIGNVDFSIPYIVSAFPAPDVDLSITKTDGSATAVPGTSITYNIVVSNAGTSDAIGAAVADPMPPELSGVTWTCAASTGSSCAANGTGDIAETVNVAGGGTVTFTVHATVNSDATGTLSNTATVTAPDLTEHSATDTDTLTPRADVSVTKTSGVTQVTAGDPVTYTIVVSNNGPSDAPEATITDFFPAALVDPIWECADDEASTCPAVGGTGDIDESMSLPAGSSMTFTVTGIVDECATGSLVNTVNVGAGPGVTDPVPGNNHATDTDSILSSADLEIVSVVADPDPVLICNYLTYTITVANNGPSCANTVVTNVLPTGVSFLSSDIGCVDVAGVQTCALGTMYAEDEVTFTITGLVDFSLKGALITDNTTVSPLATDPDTTNNSVATTVHVKPKDPYVVTLTGAPRALRIGVVTKVEYLTRVTSLCVPEAPTSNVVLTSQLPDGLDFVESTPPPDTQNGGTSTYEYPIFGGDTIQQVLMTAQLSPSAQPGTDLTHTVHLIDDLFLQGSDSFTVSVRNISPNANKLLLHLYPPRRVQAGALLKTRIGIDNTSLSPATNVQLLLTTPAEAEFVSAVPAPTSVDVVGGQTLLEWNFEKVPHKQVIRLTQRVSAGVAQESVLALDGQATDDADRFAEASKEVIVRGVARPTPTPKP